MLGFYLPAISIGKGLSGFQYVWKPVTFPLSQCGFSYNKFPTNPTGHTDTVRVVLIWNNYKLIATKINIGNYKYRLKEKRY